MEEIIRDSDGNELTKLKLMGGIVIRLVNKDTMDYVDVPWEKNPNNKTVEMLLKTVNEYYSFNKQFDGEDRKFHYWYMFNVSGCHQPLTTINKTDGDFLCLLVDIKTHKHIYGTGGLLSRVIEKTGLTVERLYNPYNIE